VSRIIAVGEGFCTIEYELEIGLMAGIDEAAAEKGGVELGSAIVSKLYSRGVFKIFILLESRKRERNESDEE
jgi:hypothetical protein